MFRWGNAIWPHNKEGLENLPRFRYLFRNDCGSPITLISSMGKDNLVNSVPEISMVNQKVDFFMSKERCFFSLPARRHFGGTNRLMGDPIPFT